MNSKKDKDPLCAGLVITDQIEVPKGRTFKVEFPLGGVVFTAYPMINNYVLFSVQQQKVLEYGLFTDACKSSNPFVVRGYELFTNIRVK